MGTAAPIEALGLHKHFGARTAVQALDLTVPEGMVFGFLGPNGAGKTTTLRMLLGLIAPSAGSVRIFGHDIRREFKAAIRQVGAMVEGPAFYPFLSARKNLRLFGRLSGGVSASRIDAVLDQVGLSARGDQRVDGFSHGMKQRLGIALALLEDPRLLVLDEPTNGLDPQGTREIRDLLRRIRDEGRTSVLLSSHLLSEMERICDRVAVLAHGRVLREGSLDELLGDEARVGQLEVPPEQQEQASRELAERIGAAPSSTRRGALEFDAAGHSLAEINRGLVSAGIAVEGLGARRRSLEEVFVELTGDASDIQ